MNAFIDKHVLAWGSLAMFFFVAGLVLHLIRNAPPEVDPIWINAGKAVVEFQCSHCNEKSTLTLPAPREYAQKFDAAFRLLHSRCAK